MRSLLPLALALLVSPLALAQAPPPYPVVFVHGLDSHEGTWAESIAHFQTQGWGAPYAYHFDLNVSDTSTAYADDVGFFQEDGLLVLADYWAYVEDPRQARRRAAHEDTVAIDYAVSGELAPGPAARFATPGEGRGARVASSLPSGDPLDTHLFAVNFHSWYDANAGLLRVHSDQNASGQSESNQSAITKQGVALALVVQDVLDRTGAEKVILVGHSMGGLAIREYLQRRAADGLPAWWPERDVADGHRTAAVVTYGTPHQGSGAGLACLEAAIGVDCDAEAVRDLRYEYWTSSDAPPYLWGGPEAIGAFFYNYDVNADGDSDDVVEGLNVGDRFAQRALDNPRHPLPLDVRYTYVTSNFTGLGDGVVDFDRQMLSYDAGDGNRYLGPFGAPFLRQIVSDRRHTTQPSDHARIADALAVDYGVPTETGPQARVTIGASVGPNPARDHVTARVTITQPARVRVEIVDVLGRVIATRDLGVRSPGERAVAIDLEGVGSGTYLLRTWADASAGRVVPFTVAR